MKQIQLDEEAEEKSKLHTSADEGLDLGKNRISILVLILIFLELEQVGGVNSPDAAQYETCYVTAHKGACRASAWTKCGNYCATGSVDSRYDVIT